MNQTELKSPVNWRPLALLVVLAASLMVVAFRLMPYGIRGANFVPAGALFLFAGARLRPRWLLPVAFISVLAVDIYFYSANEWQFPFFSYIGYALYITLGWAMLSRPSRLLRVFGTAVAGSVVFFLVTNFGVWLEHVIRPEYFANQDLKYPPDLGGLLLCFEKAIPFYRGTFLSDMVFGVFFFAGYAVLAKAYFPAESVAAAEVRS